MGTGAWVVEYVDRGGPTAASPLLLTALLQLEQALDTGVLGQLGGPGGLLLIILRGPSGSLSPSKGRAILCILGAPAGKRTPVGWGREEERLGKDAVHGWSLTLGVRLAWFSSWLSHGQPWAGRTVSCLITTSQSHRARRRANTHERLL